LGVQKREAGVWNTGGIIGRRDIYHTHEVIIFGFKSQFYSPLLFLSSIPSLRNPPPTGKSVFLYIIE